MPNDTTWKVQLTPKGPPIDRLLTQLSFSGEGVRLSTMTWTEKSGDVSTTRFSDVRVGRVFSEEEKRKYFSAPAQK
jgi:hypothetical protein